MTTKTTTERAPGPDPAGLEIRPATVADAAGIQVLYAEERHDAQAIGLGYTEEDWGAYVGAPRVILLVAEAAGTIHGVMLAFDMHDWVYLETLIVRRQARGDNLGGRLMDAVARLGEGRWVTAELAISLADRRLRRFVKKNGFYSREVALWCVKYLWEDEEPEG